jgi:hypothetical protein
MRECVQSMRSPDVRAQLEAFTQVPRGANIIVARYACTAAREALVSSMSTEQHEEEVE